MKKKISLIIILCTSLITSAQTLPTVSTASNEIWYYIQFKAGESVIQDMGAGNNLLTKMPTRNNPAQLWKVTGSKLLGYVFTSKLGNVMSYSTTLSRYQSAVSSTVKFKLTATSNTDYKPGWEMQRVGSTSYMNLLGGPGSDRELIEWTLGDRSNVVVFKLPSDISLRPDSPSSEVAMTGTAYPPTSKYCLWYRTPATDWMTQALPIGNGSFGGMIFGGVKQEEVQFNDKTLWSGNTESYGSYQNFGSLFINDISGITSVSNYKRTLDIENSLATVEYDTGDAHYKREYFCSNPDSAIAIRLTSSQTQKINVDILLWDAHFSPVVLADNSISMKGDLGLISYFAQAKIQNEGGSISVVDGALRVTNANALTIVLAGKTNYMASSPTYITSTNNTQSEVEAIINNAFTKGYDALKNSHIADYKSLFDRVSLSLGNTSNSVPTDQLITNYATDKNHLLNELYFQWGRYLMISSARGISVPSNLQGLWNNSNSPPWNSDIHSNINVEENYWPAENTNLSELHNTFLDYIYNEAIFHPQWHKNAVSSGQTVGWTCYTENNIFGYHGGFAHNYVVANAWYCMHMWQHYCYTLDKNYLLNVAYPVMKSCSQFWMERLIQDKGNSTYGFSPDGTWVCPNEYSPEHGPNEDGVAHAQQLIWDLFNNTLTAIDSLGTSISDADFKIALQTKFANLDNGLHTEVDGGKTYLREWKYTPRSVVGDYEHRHISHLVGLYPGNQISPLIDKTIFNSAVVALDSRGDQSTGWAMGHRINCWARALNGNRAYNILNYALTLFNGGGGVYQNLFDVHPPFQIDGNFAVSAGIAEMLLQSHINYTIQILPALPDAWSTEGEVKGLKATGQFEFNILWKNGLAKKVHVNSQGGRLCKILYKSIRNSTITNDASGAVIVPTVVNDTLVSFPTTIGGKYTIEFGTNCVNEILTDSYKIGSNAEVQGKVVSLTAGQTLMLKSSSASAGKWIWSGPNGFAATTPSVNLNSAKTYQNGNYLVTHTTTDFCQTTDTFKVTITGVGPYAQVKLPNNSIEAENYDYGGEGTAFHALDNTNAGNVYRKDGIDIYPCSTNYCIDLFPNEWTTYTTLVTYAVRYSLKATLKASPGTKIQFFANGTDIGTMDLPNGVSEFSYKDLPVKVILPSGNVVIKMLVLSGNAQVDALYITPFFLKNVLTPGDYQIKVNSQYLTNTNPNTTGGAPSFTSLYTADAKIPQQLWTLTIDNGHYKIVSKIDGRYLNEQCVFGTNTYSSGWNTYDILYDSLKYAIQNTQSAGTACWQYNSSSKTISQASVTDIPINFYFEFIPYSVGMAVDGVEANIDFLLKQSENEIQVVSSVLKIRELCISTLTGVRLRSNKSTMLDISHLPRGIYILTVSSYNHSTLTLKFIK